MTAIGTFYSQPHWGLRFGVIDALHPYGHRGLDIVHDAGTPIPALRGGLVVNVQYSTIIGMVVVVQVADTDFDGYAHTRNVLVSRGQHVVQGQQLAEVAGYGDLHGSAWAGPHTHFTNGPNGTSVFQGTVRDPAPVIAATLTTLAGGGSTLLEDVMPYTLIAANDAPLQNTLVYDGPFGPFVLSGNPQDALAQKQSIAAWNGVDEATVEAAIKPMSSIAVQNAIGRIPVGVDVGKLATALAPLIQHDDPDALAVAVSKALTAQLAGLPAAVVKAEGAALSNG